MHAFDVLGDPVRRRILELLAEGEHASGEVVEVISKEFGITQSAVSQQLKVLRESGFATVRAEGTRRLYAVDARPLQLSIPRIWRACITPCRRITFLATASRITSTGDRSPNGSLATVRFANEAFDRVNTRITGFGDLRTDRAAICVEHAKPIEVAAVETGFRMLGSWVAIA
jgi:DNA-binding transcriptional ArsR family regulator